MNRLLMAPPTHYGVEYEINPWMSRGRPAVPELAAEQWLGLRRLLTERMDAHVEEVAPQPGLPDMVFTANAGLVLGRRVILSRFRYAERQREAAFFRTWFEQHGFEVEQLPEGLHFEGEGDALFSGNLLFAGYHFRTDIAAHQQVGEIFGCQVLSLHLVDPRFYHLDTCFCPLSTSVAAYFPGAFDEYGCRVIENRFERSIRISPEDASRFAANAVVLGRRVACNWGCPTFESDLIDAGFEPHSTPLDEFLKAGGSAKCLVLHLDRASPAGA